MVIPCRVVEGSVTMLTMKGWVIFLIHLRTAVNLIIVPDLHQMNAGLYQHKYISQPNIYSPEKGKQKKKKKV